MIATLSGILFVKQPNQLIVDVGGVGYEVLVSARTYDRLPAPGAETFVYVYTSVREDAITLYGFGEMDEKELFLLLNTVSGVGPKLALGILSGISVSGLCEALALKDMDRLTGLSGVGRKTAQRLCMELQDKVGRFAKPGAEIDLPDKGMVEDDSFQSAVSALVNLGYPQARAWKALRTVQQQHPDEAGTMKIEALIREALRSLA